MAYPLIIYSTEPAIWFDPWGREHHVDRIVSIREITITSRDHSYTWGYGDSTETPIWIDEDGNRYFYRSPMDFGASGHWASLTEYGEEWGRWRQKGHPNSTRLINADGHPVDDNLVELP